MKNQRSIIIYARTVEPAPNESEDYVEAPGPVWVRTEVYNGTPGEALDAATPRPDEVVCNTHPLPPEPRFRLLEPGERIDQRDTWTEDDGRSWIPVPGHFVGEAWDADLHFPARRRLESYQDSY